MPKKREKRDWVWVQRVDWAYADREVYIYGYKRKPKINACDGGRMCYHTFARLTGIKLEPWDPRRMRFKVELLPEDAK